MSWAEKFKQQAVKFYDWLTEEPLIEMSIIIGCDEDDEEEEFVPEVKQVLPGQLALEKALARFNPQNELLVMPEHYYDSFGTEIALKLTELGNKVIYFPKGMLNNVAIVKIGHGFSYA